ncbi:Bardet-Biedl syndrome 7 protein homolog isoform X2 [Aphidius gifuensis]|uniref:Bardet-Biedl syndrome 7 protein homolog isoform X2 n=1 Tax=Aphidius gifuensis TaxID=684658 RepID=UPI001CDB9FE8|nr:Bardet-Biedl syndrome 7 protein homolog isoform X2 [Aphidius gifuensis]
MSLVLSRVDYLSVGITSRGTTKVLPSFDPKISQKFAVGDHDGVLQVYGFRKGELQLSFKSLPGPKIEKVMLGGSLNSSKDKIFIAYNNSVKGFSRKGKMFLEFDTSLIDSITAMYVLGPNLAACARDLYHRYENCKDSDSYLAGEILHDVALIPGDNQTVLAILACGDNAIRVLTGTKRPTILRLPSVPTVLKVWTESNTDSCNRILVGTVDGRIGLLILQGLKTIRITWIINSPGSEISSLDTFELEDGIDILVGRQDGMVEVYNFTDDEDTTPIVRYCYNAEESISSVVGGIIGAVGYPEILVTTYSGKIFGLTTRPPGSLEIMTSMKVLDRIKMEILELEQILAEESEITEFSGDNLLPLVLSANYRMNLDRESASYGLSIELDSPIDNILIQSDIPVELLDESKSSVMSLSTCDAHKGNFVLATYRCQINTNRIETRFRTIEGQSGAFQIYVTTQTPPKACRKIRIPIHALSLHARLSTETDTSARYSPDLFNKLELNGNFSVSEMHAWLSLALPDIPERPNLQDGEATLKYISTFTGTVLICKYKKGNTVVLSENIKSIIIMKDLLTREGTKRKIKLDIFCDLAEKSIARVLELILPRFEAAHILTEKLKILEALQEMEMKINSENLSSEYQELLKEEDVLKLQMIKYPKILARLYETVIDLFVYWDKGEASKRLTIETTMKKLERALQSRNLLSLNLVILGKEENSTSSTPIVYHCTKD